MKKLEPFSKSPHYENFTGSRDRAAEKILDVHLKAIDIIISKLKRKTLLMVGSHRTFIDREFALAAVQTEVIVMRLRAEIRLLSYMSEIKAMSLALGRALKTSAPPNEIKPREMPSGGSIADRITLSFSRLRRDIDDALQLSKVLGDNLEDTTARVTRAFPKTRPQPVRVHAALSKHRRLTEARRKPDLETGFFDDDTWSDILEDYTAKQLPPDIFARGPEDKALFFDVDPTDEHPERYAWEVEQEVTEDFVQEVRSGCNAAAVDNGISDFLWNAVIDSKTDECCSERDGFSSSEIEDKLDSGEIDADECDAIVAPAHFNCRCKSVPMGADLPDTPPPDFEEFDEWLTKKAAS